MWVRGKSGITDDVIFRRHMHRIGKYDNDGIDFIIIILSVLFRYIVIGSSCTFIR